MSMRTIAVDSQVCDRLASIDRRNGRRDRTGTVNMPRRLRRLPKGALLASLSAWSPIVLSAMSEAQAPPYTTPSEFESQDFVRMTWSENRWLGGPPMSETMIELVKAVAPHAKVRLLYSEWTSWLEQRTATKPQRTAEEARARLIGILREAGADIARVELVYSSYLSGAIQDPGPFFLRDAHGSMAIADYNSWHPRPEVEGLDRMLASNLGLPTVRSEVVSDGGNRQSNGRGTLLLGEAYELSVNPGMTRGEIEREHLRVHGASKVIWLKHGPAEEEHGRLQDGRWAIGTGGHIDVFARFADERTVLLPEVPEADRECDPILAETHRRMEENLAILSAATDQDGRPLRILRVPAAEAMTARIAYDELNRFERSWFEGAQPR